MIILFKFSKKLERERLEILKNFKIRITFQKKRKTPTTYHPSHKIYDDEPLNLLKRKKQQLRSFYLIFVLNSVNQNEVGGKLLFFF